jgi:hypothetical protein
MKRLVLIICALMVVGCDGASSSRYDPCSAGNQVACNLAQAQAAATIQAQDSIRLAEATRRAIDAETTKVSAYARGTEAANNAIAQSTRTYIEAKATAQAADIAATKQSYDAQATATKRADDLQATAEARRIEATRIALSAETTKAAIGYEQTRAAVAIQSEEREAEIKKNRQIQEAQTAAAREIAGEVIGVVVTIGLAVTLVLGVWYGMRGMTTWLKNRAATVRTGDNDKPVFIFHLPGGKVRIVDPDRMLGPSMGPEMEHQPANDWRILNQVTSRDQLSDLYKRMAAVPTSNGHQVQLHGLPQPDATAMIDAPRTFLPDTVELPDATPANQFVIGSSPTGLLSADRRDIRGLIAAGAPRSGKSTLMRSFAYQAARMGWMLFLADPQSNTFAPELWNRIKQVAYPVAEEHGQFVDMMILIEDELTRRTRLFRAIAGDRFPPEDLEEYNGLAHSPLMPILLIADEFNSFSGSSDIIEPLTDLARRGQKFGLMVVLAAHSWRSADIPRATADLLQSRIAFRLNSPESARMILYNRADVATVTHIDRPGRAVVVLNGASQQVQTCRVDRARIVSMAIDDPVSAPPRPPDPPRQDRDDEVQTIAEKIRPHWESGESKRQMALAAGFTQYGGGPARKIDAAIAWLDQHYGATAATATT